MTKKHLQQLINGEKSLYQIARAQGITDYVAKTKLFNIACKELKKLWITPIAK